MASSAITILELDIKELENAIRHLERSNEDISEFAKTGATSKDEVEDWAAIIQENQVAIKKKTTRLEDLRQQLLEAGGGGQCVAHQVAEPSVSSNQQPELADENRGLVL